MATPMRLRGENGHTLEVTILGYESPDAGQGHESGPDWLLAFITVSTPRGSWDASAAPFMATELDNLASWLEAIAVAGDVGDAKEFLDPLLYFEYRGKKGDAVVLRIGFGLEFAPPWSEERFGADPEENCIDFLVTPAELTQASRSLRSFAQMFPLRGARM